MIADIAGIAKGFAFEDGSILQQDPFQIISQDQIAGQLFVFGDLLRPQNLVQIFFDLLVFQIAKYALVGLEFELSAGGVMFVVRLLISFPARRSEDVRAKQGVLRSLSSRF
jgi:hypothetical protein